MGSEMCIRDRPIQAEQGLGNHADVVQVRSIVEERHNPLDYCEDYDYCFEEYDEIDQERLDALLSEDDVEIVGDLEFENKMEGVDPLSGEAAQAQIVFKDVRIRRTVNKSKVKVENVPPENFRISRDAKSIEEAAFVGIQFDMTRSEIRKWWPEVADNIKDWDELGHSENWLGNARYSEDIAARKYVTGQEYWQGSVSQDLFPLEANREVTVTECWLRVDRDGDGITELKHFIIAGSTILYEEDVEMIPLASISPIDIPHEFYGLSMADFTRSSTLASTAILRGFVENTYLTNYSPKLADPNVVDFSALQNMKPKQIIPTNGNPAAAVAPLPPETISPGTVPLLEHLQTIKEKATGMSKAAQGINDELYVSGNSEAKMAAVQSANHQTHPTHHNSGIDYIIRGRCGHDPISLDLPDRHTSRILWSIDGRFHSVLDPSFYSYPSWLCGEHVSNELQPEASRPKRGGLLGFTEYETQADYPYQREPRSSRRPTASRDDLTWHRSFIGAPSDD